MLINSGLLFTYEVTEKTVGRKCGQAIILLHYYIYISYINNNQSSQKKVTHMTHKLIIITAEDEYKTEKTLPAFAKEHLKDFDTTQLTLDPTNQYHIADLSKLAKADLAIFSIRRRPLIEADMKIIRDYVASKKPLIAIRTTSHGFAPRKGEKLPFGVVAWEKFDQEILGCTYTGHYSNKVKTNVTIAEKAKSHELFKGITVDKFVSPSWLYKSGKLAENCTTLMLGKSGEEPEDTVAWIREASDKHGRIFYTCLGAEGDFELAEFRQLLCNAANWAVKK